MIEAEADERYMREAIRLAGRAMAEGEPPVGCVIAYEGRVIARAHNQRELLRDPTAHAEMIALTQAANALDRWRLHGATVYCTVEPCCMCAGAIVNARIPLVVFGAADPKAGAVSSLFHLLNDDRLNHRCEVMPGVMAAQCGEILTGFFQRQRRMGKK